MTHTERHSDHPSGASIAIDADADADDRDPRVDRTRSVVLEAGTEILFDRGPEAVTHAAVASAARVSRTTLYKHWPTRAELLFDVLDQVEPHKRIEPSGDIRADMREMGRRMAASFGDERLNKVLSSLLAQAQWDDASSGAQQALIDAAMSDMAVVLDAAVEAGQLPAGIEPIRLAGRLVGPIFFAAMIARQPLSLDEVDALVDDWFALLER